METWSGPLPVSTLLLFEFRQSIRFQMRLHRLDRTRGFTRGEGLAMLRDLQDDIANRVLESVPVDWPNVHQIAEHLSATHTESGGHRFADILHVATALYLGKDSFLTFDENQARLASAESLVVPFQ